MKVQAWITLPPETRRDIDQLRNIWNPEKATGNPAHITVAYQDEAPDVALLTNRLREAVARITPFHLIVGTAARFAEPIRGVFLTVVDPTGGVTALRNQILTPPFTRRSRFGLHITLLHPDQGHRLEQAWPEFERLSAAGPFTVTHLQLVGPHNEVMAELAFEGAVGRS